jgi:hypothetical protein
MDELAMQPPAATILSEALQRFFDRLTGNQSIVTPPTITQRQRLREIERAEEYLRRHCI